MAQTLVVNFKESPFSTWGAASLLPGTPSNLSPSLSNSNGGSLRFQTIGSISAVNAQISELGLKRRGFLPPLVAEESTVERMERSKPKQSESSELKDVTDAKLIELATYPGFSPDAPTPLPHGLDTLEHLKLVTRAQTRLAIKREGFRECWRKLFYSPYSRALILDTFWWFFLQKYQPNEGIQGKLFSRVSVNYVRLLCVDCEQKWRDVFFKVYPDVVAQAVYSAFIHAFPASWSSFDDPFKTDLCKTVFLWQVGTKPIPDSWQRWNLDALEPPNLLKHVGKEDQSPTSPQGFHLDALVKETKRKETFGSELSPVKPRSPPPVSMTVKARKCARSPTHADSLQDSASSLPSPSSSASLQERVSFAEIEKALCSQSQLLQQQTTNVANARTHGEATPTQQSTAAQRKKIEVAKQQLAKLKMQKVIEAKAKAAKRTRSTGTSTSKAPKTSTSSKPNQPQLPHASSKTTPAGSQAATMKQKTNAHDKPAIPSNGPKSGAPPVQSGATAKTRVPAGPNPAVRTTHAGSVATCTVSSKSGPGPTKAPQTQPSKPDPAPTKVPQLIPVQASRNEVSSKAVAASRGQAQEPPPHPSPAAKESHQASGVAASGEEKDRDKQPTETWKEKALAMKKKVPAVPLCGPKFEHVVFDAHGQSPLVKYYLQKRNLTYDSGYSLLLQRTEVDKLPPADAPTYEDIIRDSSKEDKRNYAQFKSHYARQKQSMAQNHHQRKKATAKHQQDVKKVLADKKEVQQLGTELAEHRNKKGEKVGDRQSASKAIAQTLRRVA